MEQIANEFVIWKISLIPIKKGEFLTAIHYKEIFVISKFVIEVFLYL